MNQVERVLRVVSKDRCGGGGGGPAGYTGLLSYTAGLQLLHYLGQDLDLPHDGVPACSSHHVAEIY